MTAPVVVFAVGNPSRGDDAIGPILCGQLEKWLENSGHREEVELIEDFQLNIEHALDLQQRQLALFIDAGERTPAPWTFARIFPVAVPSHTSHALAPGAVLQVYRQLEGREPPPSFVLCVRGEAFELGACLSEAAEENQRAALALLEELLAAPGLGEWESIAAAWR